MGGEISIHYEYSVPKSQESVEKFIKHSWKADKYGECNKKCNGGRCGCHVNGRSVLATLGF